MTALTRDDVIKAVGEIDDVTIAEIIGTGATAEELRTAPSPRSGEGAGLRQFSLRFGTGASNCAISAVCGVLPLKVSTLPSVEMAT